MKRAKPEPWETTAKRPTLSRRFRAVLLTIAALTLTAVTVPSYAQVTSNVLLRTVLIQASDKLGTAFTIEVDGRQYLITAKHVVNMFPDEAASTILVRKKNGWVPLKVTVFKCDEPVDVAVLVPPAQVTVNYPLEPSSKSLAAGQDAYFVGFPYGDFATYANQPTVFPFVKKATVGQFQKPTANTQIIDLDAYNNPGFSGSPVVYRDLYQSGYVLKVAGVLVSYIYNASTVVNKKEEIHENEITAEDREKDDVVRTMDGRFYRVENTKELVKLNSGIAIAWDIGSAVDLIRKHPIGPNVTDNFTDESVGPQSK